MTDQPDNPDQPGSRDQPDTPEQLADRGGPVDRQAVSNSEGLLTVPWRERSSVPAVMFNPALMAVVVATAADQYEESKDSPMPWPLAFLVPPMVLHGPTRDALPRTSRTSLSSWVGSEAVLVAGFAARARHLAPQVREGIRFGLRHDILVVTRPSGGLTNPRTLKGGRNSPGDLTPVVRGAGMLGRIFARTGDAADVYATLRVRP